MGWFTKKPHPDCEATVQEPVRDADGDRLVRYPGCDRRRGYEASAYYADNTDPALAKELAEQRVDEHKTKGIWGW